MKKIIFVLLAVFSLSVSAQESITEGVAIIKQTMSSTNEQMNSQLAMLGEMVTTTYFKENKSRSEMFNLMMGNTITIVDGDKKEMLMMTDNQMIGKKYMTAPTEPSEADLANMTITKGEETKTILGYLCHQYQVSMKKSGVDVKMNVYATEALNILTQQTSSFGSDFKGFPLLLEMTVNQAGAEIVIKYEVSEIKKESISDDKFDMTPLEGYKKADNLGGL